MCSYLEWQVMGAAVSDFPPWNPPLHDRNKRLQGAHTWQRTDAEIKVWATGSVLAKGTMTRLPVLWEVQWDNHLGPLGLSCPHSRQLQHLGSVPGSPRWPAHSETCYGAHKTPRRSGSWWRFSTLAPLPKAGMFPDPLRKPEAANTPGPYIH